MGSVIVCAPNYVQSTYYPPVFGGGGWGSANYLSYLADKYFIRKAISVDATTTKTRFDVDFQVGRDIKFIGIPNSNIEREGKIRVLGSNVAAWSGATVNGAHSIGATVLSIAASGAVTIAAGECFTLAGDTKVYNVTIGTSIAAGGTGAITIERADGTGTGLVVSMLGGEAITCRSGNFTSPVIDTTLLDYFPEIYGDELPWGAAGVWDGKESPEVIATLQLPNQWQYIVPTLTIARYLRVLIEDTTNSNGYITLDGLYVTSGYVPTYNMEYGVQVGFITNTSSESSAGGVEVFKREKSQRFIEFNLSDIPVQEAFINLFDIQRQLDLDGDAWIVFDEEDTKLMNRRSFPCRLEALNPISTIFFDGTSVTLRWKEKIA